MRTPPGVARHYRGRPAQSSSAIQGLALFVFLSSLLTLPWAYRFTGMLLVSLAAMAVLVRRSLPRDAESLAWVAMLALFGCQLVLDAGRSGPPLARYSVPSLPWWPWLGLLLLLAWRARPPSLYWWWRGITLGAVLSGLKALYDRLIEDERRAGDLINAIPFGNLSLVLGVLSLVWWLDNVSEGRRGLFLWWAALGAVMGLLGSLLSGTRGGWLTLPLVMLVLVLRHGRRARLYWSTLTPRRRFAIRITATLAIGVATLVALPRLWALAEDIVLLWRQGAVDTNAGLRWHLWGIAGEAFAARPLWGWGEDGLVAWLETLVAAGRLPEGMAGIGFQLHSDVLDTAARRGLAGVALLLLFYGIPLASFLRRLDHGDGQCRVLALSGALIVVMYAGFGLTQTMFRDPHTFSAYLVMCTACFALLRTRG